MIWLAPLAAAVGGFWRRWFGGWKQGERWSKLLLLAALLSPAWWFSSSWYAGLPIVLLIASFVPGHTWSNGWWVLARRYAPWHIAVGAGMVYVVGAWGALCFLNAVIVPTWYYLADRYPKAAPKEIVDDDLIDGTIALAELLSGATVVGLFYAAVLA